MSEENNKSTPSGESSDEGSSEPKAPKRKTTRKVAARTASGFAPPTTDGGGPGSPMGVRGAHSRSLGRAAPEPRSFDPLPAHLQDALKQMAATPPPVDVGGDEAQSPLLFELAWEVCWQLGGIYTVIRSKAATMVNAWQKRYCLIGPYNADTAAIEFEPAAAPPIIAHAIDRLAQAGVKAYYGYWLIDGRPQVILLDFRAAFHRLGEFKHMLWADHRIESPPADGDVDNVIAFGFLVGMFFQALSSVCGNNRPIVAHFHEWMSGLGLMRIKYLRLPVATVFTTHATLLGRYLCTDNPDFYAKIGDINPDHAAGHYNIYARYCIERGAASLADVFTTVSDVTAMEAEKLLCRRPDVITPNGLNINKFSFVHEFQNLHKQYKEAIHKFVAGHFFPSYTFDLDRTIYLFTAGRYEYTNKGINLFIESLARLNHWLRSAGVKITVVAFIVTRANFRSMNVDVLKNQALFDDLGEACKRVSEHMGQRLFHHVSMGKIPNSADLIDEEDMVRLKRSMHAWRNWRQPSIVTHDLWDDANDPILQQLRYCRLFNGREDPVKVVFHPDFLSATSPLIRLDYDQFVRGCHMGVFPSYYEPWGYTPMECVASGVTAVTSDLAGFGSYVLQNIADPAGQGLFVVNRRSSSFDAAANQLTEILFNYAIKDRRGRIELRNRVERLSEYFDWANLISHYSHAYRMALRDKVPAV
ncbi:MAG: glycosyltransferase [Phycisphaerae bacterium]